MKALRDLVHRAVDVIRVDEGGRAAAEIDGIERFLFEFFAPHLDLLDEARHVRFGVFGAAREGSEIAVGALVFAEWDMQIDACHLRPPKKLVEIDV